MEHSEEHEGHSEHHAVKVYFDGLFGVQVRSDNPDDEAKSEWMDLLYDLVFVGFAVSLSTVISHAELTVHNFGVAFMFASNFWASWLFMTNLRNTFKFAGFIFYMSMLLNTIGHAGSAAELDMELQYREHFAYWRLLIHVTEGAMAFVVFKDCPRGRSWMVVNFVTYVLPSVLCYAIFIAIPYTLDLEEEKSRRVMCKAIYGCFTFFTWTFHFVLAVLLQFRLCTFPAFSVGLYVMRLEEITMILLGETFIAVIMISNGIHDSDVRICGTMCMCLVFFAGSWYFASQPHHPHDHPIAHGALRSNLSFFLARATGLVALFFGCYVKTLLYLMVQELGPPAAGHRRLAGTHSSSDASSSASSASSSASHSSSVGSTTASNASASSSNGSAAADGSSHASGHVSAASHAASHGDSETALHLVIGLYAILMLIINTASLLKNHKGHRFTWTLTFTLIGIRYVCAGLLFCLLLSSDPVLCCSTLVAVAFLNYPLGYVFYQLRKPTASKHTVDVHSEKVHAGSGELKAKAHAALQRLSEASETEALMRKALDNSDMETVSKIMAESSILRHLNKIEATRRRQAFVHHEGHIVDHGQNHRTYFIESHAATKTDVISPPKPTGQVPEPQQGSENKLPGQIPEEGPTSPAPQTAWSGPEGNQ